MKKLSSLLSVIVFLSFLSNTAFAQLGQPVPTVTTTPTTATPQPAFPVKNVQFFGQWTFDMYGGSRVDMSGSVISLPYSQIAVTFNGGQVNSDGSMFFSGVVDNEYGSSVQIYYNPTVEKRHMDMYMYIPNMEFGVTNQFLQVQYSMFIAPHGDYLYGTMSAKEMSLSRDGASWITRASFIGKADGFQTQTQTAPMIGDAPAVGGGSSGGKG